MDLNNFRIGCFGDWSGDSFLGGAGASYAGLFNIEALKKQFPVEAVAFQAPLEGEDFYLVFNLNCQNESKLVRARVNAHTVSPGQPEMRRVELIIDIRSTDEERLVIAGFVNAKLSAC